MVLLVMVLIQGVPAVAGSRGGDQSGSGGGRRGRPGPPGEDLAATQRIQGK